MSPMGSTDYAKELAAKKSLDFIEDGMVVGLGDRLDRNLLHQTPGRARQARSENSCHPVIEHEQGTRRISCNPDYRFSAVSRN